MTSSCPSDSELQAFAIGAVNAQRLRDLAEHLKGCSACSRSLEMLDGHKDEFVSELSQLDAQHESIDLDVPDEVILGARHAVSSLGVASSNMNLDPGRRYAKRVAEGPCYLGRFELQAELGDGSFGYVFRAHDPKLDRTVAVKILRSGSLADETEIDRFFHEARSAAQLQHPGIVALYECGRTEDDVCFLVAEYVNGNTLEDRLQSKIVEPEQAAELVANLAEALQYAHDRDVIHRDIKPSNIILDASEKPHITDFGLAKRLVADQTMTSDGHVVGTPAYMSPEQARGDRVDSRTDVYSLGVVLFELLTGERPFQGNRRLVMNQVINEDPRSPRELDDHIPKDLETICLKAMSRSINRRYQSAKELADDLHRYLEGDAIHARPLGYLEGTYRWCRRNPIAVSLLFAVTVGSIVGFSYLSYLSTYFVEHTALDSARNEAIMFEGIRDHYSEKLIDPVDAKIRAALPSPAPYLIEVGDYISQGKSGMKVQLYSSYPWRPRPEKDAFQMKALELLDQRARNGDVDLSHYEFPVENGRRLLRYAKGQIMIESCVKCHNETKESPKRDWKVGDLVGVLEVTRPLDREIERTRQGLRGAFLLIACTGTILAGLSLGLVLASRKRAYRKKTN